MLDFINEYKQEFIRIISVSVMSLAIVYAFGRMLSIVKTYIHKNFIALISIVSINSYYSIILLKLNEKGWESLVWDIGLYSAFCIIIYVLVGFKLYERADTFLDKKIGDVKKEKK